MLRYASSVRRVETKPPKSQPSKPAAVTEKNRQPPKRANLTYAEKRSDADLRIWTSGGIHSYGNAVLREKPFRLPPDVQSPVISRRRGCNHISQKDFDVAAVEAGLRDEAALASRPDRQVDVCLIGTRLHREPRQRRVLGRTRTSRFDDLANVLTGLFR
jgi:hypothetical protein